MMHRHLQVSIMVCLFDFHLISFRGTHMHVPSSFHSAATNTGACSGASLSTPQGPPTDRFIAVQTDAPSSKEPVMATGTTSSTDRDFAVQEDAPSSSSFPLDDSHGDTGATDRAQTDAPTTDTTSSTQPGHAPSTMEPASAPSTTNPPLRRTCQGTTLKGQPCGRFPQKGSKFCHSHHPKE